MAGEKINCLPWHKKNTPKKILVIRLHALGDVTITLPYVASLKSQFPEATIDYLTMRINDSLLKNIEAINVVYSLRGWLRFKIQVLSALLLLPKLFISRYDVVVDLQRNPISRLIRKTLRPPCWSEFDRFSPLSAGKRTCLTIEALELGKLKVKPRLILRNNKIGITPLREAGWDPEKKLIILNPAGCFPSKNWPLTNYVAFSKLWRNHFPKTQFLILGTNFIRSRSDFLVKELKSAVVNLVGSTDIDEVFSIIQKVDFILTEDSGLMHMAWVSGVPTLALFGSSRHDWSAPLGNYTLCLHSGDLPCGSCMDVHCRYGDVHCLTRFTPEKVYKKAAELYRLSQNCPKII